MKKVLFSAILAGLAVPAVTVAQPTHYLYQFAGRESSEANVPSGSVVIGESPNQVNFVNILVADLDATVNPPTVGNWREAGSLPLENAAEDAVDWSYIDDAVHFYNSYVYVGPSGSTAGGTVASSNSVAYALVLSDGSIGNFEFSPALPSAAENPRILSAEIVEVNGDPFYYIFGGSSDGGVNNRVFYAPIDSVTGAVGAWSQATASLPSNDWFHSSTNVDGTIIVFDGNTNSGSADIWIATPEPSGDITSWNTVTYTTDYNQRWDNVSLTAVSDGNEYVYTYAGTIGGVGETDRVDFAPATGFDNAANWGTTNSVPAPRRRVSGASSDNVLALLGGSTSGSFVDGTNSVFIGVVASNGEVTWTDDSNAGIDALPTNRSFGGSLLIQVPEATNVQNWDLFD